MFNFNKMESISESTLLDVFGVLKGKQGKNRAYVLLTDFQFVIETYKPESMPDSEDVVEDLFRSICDFKNVSLESPRFSNSLDNSYKDASQLKLFFDHFKRTWEEFDVLYEVTIKILNDMGIFPKNLLRVPKQPKNDFADTINLTSTKQNDPLYNESGNLTMGDVS